MKLPTSLQAQVEKRFIFKLYVGSGSRIGIRGCREMSQILFAIGAACSPFPQSFEHRKSLSDVLETLTTLNESTIRFTDIKCLIKVA